MPTRSSARCITSTAGAPWTEWPAPLRDREPEALEAARVRLGAEIRYRLYLQWIADQQWRAARDAAGDVAIFGDLPFMVALRQRRRLGAPGRVPPGRVSGRAARRVQRHRSGLEPARVPMGRDGARRIRVADVSGPPERGLCSTATGWTTWSASSAPSSASPTARPASRPPKSRAGGAGRTRAAACSWRRAPRSWRRIWGSFPTSCARR